MSTSRTLLRPAFAGLAVTSLALLAACGGGSDASTATGSSSQSANGGSSSTDQAGQGGFPGASGLVADVSGSTAQVQSQQSGQVAVTWTDSTTFTAQVSAKLSAVTVGSCVQVTPADTSSDSSDSSTVAAGSVTITEAGSDGTCTRGGFGGGGGGQGGGAPSGAPSGMPTDMPSDMASGGPGGNASGGPGGGQGGGGFGTFGTVTAVSASGFTVEAVSMGAPGSDASSSASTTTSSVSVTVDDSTTYTTTESATSQAVKTGVCVTAMGDTDDTGALTATSIAVSQATDGECTTGFGRGGMGGGQGGQSGQGGGA
ncbi:MAG: DUF5666 domain-containing protein [Nocardioides sp.]|uniref:hypothetical protein n=1 Tax=Nocardioides sp. TaxID=35761 RepID=UPI0039E397B6